MASSVVSFLLLVLSALLGGLYTTPMTAVKTGWSFEAVWFLYSLFGIVILPWVIGLLTCPNLIQAFGAVSTGKLILTSAFGVGWGCGCQLFGIGISMCGNSLGFALILGLAATLGNVVPLIILNTDKVATATGAWDFTGLGLAIIALIATAYAGILKERDRPSSLVEAGCSNGDENTSSVKTGTFKTGIVVCVISGVLSACLNFANTFGAPIADAAVDHGADETMKLNAVYCISIVSGGIPNLLYPLSKIAYSGDWPFKYGGVAFAKNVVLALVMGSFWFGSNVAFGAGSSMLGDMGAVVGFPIYIIGMVIVANVSGVVQGEWEGASTKAKIWMAIGLILLMLAIGACWLAGSASHHKTNIAVATTLAADMIV